MRVEVGLRWRGGAQVDGWGLGKGCDWYLGERCG